MSIPCSVSRRVAVRSMQSDMCSWHFSVRFICLVLAVQRWYVPASGMAVMILPANGCRRSAVKLCFPPVASHRNLGYVMEHIRAVFSLSTSPMGLVGCRGNRCSPNRHCFSWKSAGSLFCFMSMLCAQLKEPGRFLRRLPEWGS